MMEFKVGDRVKVKKVPTVGFLSGQIGTITETGTLTEHGVTFNQYQCRIDIENAEYTFREDELEKYCEKKAELTKFGIGDRVKTKEYGLSSGEGVITGICCHPWHPWDSSYYQVKINGCDFATSYSEEKLELIKKAPSWRIEITPDGDKTTATLYKHGKLKRSATVKRYHEDKYDVCIAATEAVKKLYNEKKKCESNETAKKLSDLADLSVKLNEQL